MITTAAGWRLRPWRKLRLMPFLEEISTNDLALYQLVTLRLHPR